MLIFRDQFSDGREKGVFHGDNFSNSSFPKIIFPILSVTFILITFQNI